jgi:signal transduction histidine kinase
MTVTGERRSLTELERVADEQAALRRIATLVAEGATEDELAAAVTSEIGLLFRADRANTMRLEGDTIRVIGGWDAEDAGRQTVGLVFPSGGDTTTARIASTGAPSRVDSLADLQSELGRSLWAERGLHASIGAPIVVGGKLWGVVTAFRTRPGDPFAPEAEFQLRDFAALVAQSIVNAESRRETAELIAELSALRRIATLVAGGRPQTEVLAAVTSEVGELFEASTVQLVRWEGIQDEVFVVEAWSGPGAECVERGSLYHPNPGSATLQVLETGLATRSEESSPEHGPCSTIAAPVIVNARLLGALTASRPASVMFTPGAETHLRSFSDLAAQSIANERAQAELRASRARIVRTADETRRRLERNLHDGAQQRLVSLSLALRLAAARLPAAPEEARAMLVDASEELAQALEELRDLARGLHPAMLSERGLGPSVNALAARLPILVEFDNELDGRLPEAFEAAAFYVVSESLTNVVKHAQASQANVRIGRANGVTLIEVADDGVGGANIGDGSGLLGLADRIEALGGSFAVESEPGKGTTVRAVLPFVADA